MCIRDSPATQSPARCRGQRCAGQWRLRAVRRREPTSVRAGGHDGHACVDGPVARTIEADPSPSAARYRTTDRQDVYKRQTRYRALLEGLEAVEIKYSAINEELRYEAEFFQKCYLRED